MRKNDAFDAKIVTTRLTKIFIAIFAPEERLPNSATLLWCKTIFGCKYEVDREAVEVNIAHPISCSKFNADFGAKQYLVAYFSLDNCPLYINITHHKYV